MNKTWLIFFIGLVIVAFAFYCYRHLLFAGTFDKKYTREKLTENFVRNESKFDELVTFFNAKIINVKEQTVSFGLSKANKVSLIISPNVIDPANKTIGGNDLELGSPKLDSALVLLQWTNETVGALKDKLAKTNCDWIRTTEIYGKPVELYPNQKGWSSFAYRVFDMPLPDSLVQIHGRPISNSEFGRRVVLDYSSAL